MDSYIKTSGWKPAEAKRQVYEVPADAIADGYNLVEVNDPAARTPLASAKLIVARAHATEFKWFTDADNQRRIYAAHRFPILMP